MPYYLFKISAQQGMSMVKNLELLEEFESFKTAKNRARELRTDQAENADFAYKVMFADNQLRAEEQLLEKRDKPIVMEHEK